MRIKFPYGSTQENDGLLLPEGMLSVDLERKALRLHDGTTPGGFELVGEQAYYPPPPGPQELVGGDLQAGFYGETTTTELINGPDLATLLSLTAGTAQFSNEPWLKFALDGRILYVAKKPLRHSISWDAIQAVNAVDGTRIISIGSYDYRIRLLRGANSDPYEGVNSFDPTGSWGSEWNRLMYHVSGLPFGNAGNTLGSEGITEGDWAQYSEADLLTYNSGVNGSYSWCQEVGTSASARVIRGNGGVSYLAQDGSSSESTGRGWRPCLELVT